MVTLTELQAEVAESYDRLGMPSWPDPHPGGASPRDEEYSRVTDAERYRIVHIRARAWAEQLGGLPGVEVEPVVPGPLGDGRHEFDRGARLRSSRPDTLPLLMLECDMPLTQQEGVLPGLHIGVVRPDVIVEMQPDCGCDACDSGSDDLLRAIDKTIAHVVGGPFVALRGTGWRAEWHPDGGSAGGKGRGPGFSEMMDLCRRLAAGEDVRLPTDAEAFIGRSWLG